jgi:dTDP-3-amino-3,4,6-trideoxy-alpha-D-glucose transaminase
MRALAARVSVADVTATTRIAPIDLRVGLAELGVELEQAMSRVVASGVHVLGPEVAAFESEFAAFCGVRHCVGVGNGTDALALALRACDIGAGDEVIVPAYTAVPTWMAVSMIGATPVGVDVDEHTYSIAPAAAAAAVTPNTKAIVAVHLFGVPADIAALAQIAAEHGLVLIEDAAQAHGARDRGAPVGGLARAAAFSFYPTKNLAAIGDGGAVTTDDSELADRVRLLRSYGWRERGVSEIKGVNSRLDELQAAILRVKLAHLEDGNDRRAMLAARYGEGLSDLGSLALPEVPEWATPVWHQFVVGVEDRGSVREALDAQGVGTLVHYDPLPHLTPTYRADGWRAGSLPAAERLSGRAVSLPMYPQLTLDACDRVIEGVRHAAGQRS